MSIVISTSNSNFYMASSFAAGKKFSKGTSPNVYVEYFQQGFIDMIARLYNEEDQSEKWYRYDADQKNWFEIAHEQLWFWTNKWQQGEREADEDIRLGRYEDFEDLDSFFDI